MLPWIRRGIRRRRRRLHQPPGIRLWGIVTFLFTRKVLETVFLPLRADFEYEYCESLNDGRPWRARWMRLVYFVALLKAAGIEGVLSLVGDCVKAARGFQKK